MHSSLILLTLFFFLSLALFSDYTFLSRKFSHSSERSHRIAYICCVSRLKEKRLFVRRRPFPPSPHSTPPSWFLCSANLSFTTLFITHQKKKKNPPAPPPSRNFPSGIYIPCKNRTLIYTTSSVVHAPCPPWQSSLGSGVCRHYYSLCFLG